MTYPRLTQGRIGAIAYTDLNRAFRTLERVERHEAIGTPYARDDHYAVVGVIDGLMSGFTQGAAQAGGAPVGATAIKTYLYSFTEIDWSIGDGTVPPDTINSYLTSDAGITSTDTTTLTGGGSVVSKIVAVDTALVQRFAAGDIVHLQSLAHRTGGTTSSGEGTPLVRYMVIASEPKSASFLARLTATHPSIEGIYEWTALDREMTAGTVALSRAAINLYELNDIRQATSLGTDLYSGSGNWGHGQVLTGGGGLGTMTKNPLPVGGSGAGTIVHMHESPVNHFHFYSVAPVTPACPP